MREWLNMMEQKAKGAERDLNEQKEAVKEAIDSRDSAREYSVRLRGQVETLQGQVEGLMQAFGVKACRIRRENKLDGK